jgi:hypothetical protein
MSNPPPQPPDTRIDISQAVVQGSRVSVNVGQDFIATTRDKLELALIRYEQGLRARGEWIAPLGILLALLPSLLGAQFSDFLGFRKEVWQALYVVGAVLSAVWLFLSLVRLYRSRSERGIEAIIQRLRPSQTTSPRLGARSHEHSWWRSSPVTGFTFGTRGRGRPVVSPCFSTVSG